MQNYFKNLGFISNNMTPALAFFGGLISGAILTLLWLCKSSGSVLGEDDIEFAEYVSDSEQGSNKLIIVVRSDLKMGKGKVAAQCSHAAVLAHELSRKKCPYIFADWKRNGQPKIVLKINNEEEMWDIAKEAQKHQLLVSVVKDAGRTQVASGSKTVLAVGPGPENLIDKVTGHLKLY